jgi:hypothetical protein
MKIKVKNRARLLKILDKLLLIVSTLLFLDLGLFGYMLVAAPMIKQNTLRHQEMEQCYANSNNNGISYIHIKKGRAEYIYDNEKLYNYSDNSFKSFYLKNNHELIQCLSNDILPDCIEVTDIKEQDNTNNQFLYIRVNGIDKYYKFNNADNSYIQSIIDIFKNEF